MVLAKRKNEQQSENTRRTIETKLNKFVFNTVFICNKFGTLKLKILLNLIRLNLKLD